MKRLVLFLLRINIHLMTLVFVVTAVWAAFHWTDLVLIQRLNMGAYLLLVLHEYEEGYKGRFVALMTGAAGIDVSYLKPGVTHISQAIAITVLFLLPMFFPEQLWIAFAGYILCVFEGFVHTFGIRLFRLGKPSPGWYTAVIMCVYAIWAIIVFNPTLLWMI